MTCDWLTTRRTTNQRHDTAILIHKQSETHGCPVGIVATDVLVLKHQAVITHNVDHKFILLDHIHTKILRL